MDEVEANQVVIFCEIHIGISVSPILFHFIVTRAKSFSDFNDTLAPSGFTIWSISLTIFETCLSLVGLMLELVNAVGTIYEVGRASKSSRQEF